MNFNENSRVKIPVILHLMRLGYEYLSLRDCSWDAQTNIFPDLFLQSVAKINPGVAPDDLKRALADLKLTLDNEDLGRAFYEKITDPSGIRFIDFENFKRNSFHVVTELPCQNGDDEFRPDITLLINGMPLVFIEVKKPNNPEGILAERDRINRRFQNPRFRRFVNVTQFMIFSNNMEYDAADMQPIQGAFYATTSYDKPMFNYFREEDVFNYTALLKPLPEEAELNVLKDNNLEVIRTNPEFLTNKEPDRPTNRLCTSLLSRERLAFVLRYGLAYVQEETGLQKHIMRYPQFFATKAIEASLEKGERKGIIWHTQGSGKTALAFFNVRRLTDYFQKKQIIPKFYFIVDRIDLLKQAAREFKARDLNVHEVNSREEFSRDIKSTQAIHNHSGRAEITVVNIQKFENDSDVVSSKDYNVDVQRVYFLDEVHRSYNPKGSFLANLNESDRNAIKIGLTGTPLLGQDYNSRTLFGDYIHKYYYNASIADGYTLRLIREEIETHYKMELKKALEELEIKQGSLNKSLIYAHPSYAEPLLDYIVADFEKSRAALNDWSIGAMVICDSSAQAKMLYEIFQRKYAVSEEPCKPAEILYSNVADKPILWNTQKEKNQKVKSALLILHDEGTSEEREDWISRYKEGKYDILFVYNMLLTGFDAHRLKKLYLGRVIKKHNLLQALTRVNRPYKDFRYGYVVDFADIRKEFAETNRAYLNELQSELGDEMEHYSQLFKTKEEIQADIERIKDVLFRFDTRNAEIFSQQISEIKDRKKVLILKKALEDARDLYNLIRYQGEYSFLNHLDFPMLNNLYRETCNHLDFLNLKESLEQGENTENLLNVALEDVFFRFTKVGEEELVLADQLQNSLRETREELASNFDHQDPQFITLRAELERVFKKKNLNEVTQEEMNKNIQVLRQIYEKVKELNRQNNLLRGKYHGDAKYARIHKRLMEKEGGTGETERKVFDALMQVKQDADEEVLNNSQILQNENYFERSVQPFVITRFMKDNGIKLNPQSSRNINHLIVNEYLNEYNGAKAW